MAPNYLMAKLIICYMAIMKVEKLKKEAVDLYILPIRIVGVHD